jgi:serine phosphatase RsbU (regulator of sigma subunit)
MREFLYAVARRFWPELAGMTEARRLVGVGEVITVLVAAPLAVLGLIWLAAISNPQVITQNWQVFLLFAALIFLFERVGYFIIVEIIGDRYGSADGSLSSMILWTASLIFGPTALWLSVLAIAVRYIWSIRQTFTATSRWSWLRSLCLDLATATLAFLVALAAYQLWGGSFPLPGLDLESILPAFGAVLVHFGLVLAIWGGYISYSIWIQRLLTGSFQPSAIVLFTLMALGLPVLSHPYGILAAGLYVRDGIAVFLFFISGVLLVAYLARKLSWAAESSRQGSRQLEKLEHLSREIITAPPDASTLLEILAKHVPSMFPSSRVAVWLAPDRYLLKYPEEWPVDLERVWDWILTQGKQGVAGADEPRAFLASEQLPWDELSWANHDPVIVAPVLDVENRRPVGLVFIEMRTLAHPWDQRGLTSQFHAVNSLAEQVASVLNQAQVYEETLAYQGAMQELSFAGRIQASFLPSELPRLDGWELAVTLIPARETSGDFFDFLPISEDRIGILVADVADKGLGAALYMALSRTLIRTYALEYVDAQPELVFFSANERILQDARANLFVTAFYGILDQKTGLFSYANAGHNSPFLLSLDGSLTSLIATGMPIGIEEEAVWGQGTVQIQPGDVLLFYTDGVTDAQNREGEFFGEKRLVEVAQAHKGQGAQELQAAIIAEIQEFVGEAPQFDDITLLVLARDVPGREASARKGERKEPSGIPALLTRRVL